MKRHTERCIPASEPASEPAVTDRKARRIEYFSLLSALASKPNIIISVTIPESIVKALFTGDKPE